MARTDVSKGQKKGQKNPRPGYAAGSEGWDGSEDPTQPVASSDESVAGRPARDAEAGSSTATTQSDYSLSQGDTDGGRFEIAEEVNFDQQSADARRVGQTPGPEDDATLASESGEQATKSAGDKAGLSHAADRAIPPSP